MLIRINNPCYITDWLYYPKTLTSKHSSIVMNIANITVILIIIIIIIIIIKIIIIIIEMFLVSSVCCYVDGLYYNLEGLHQQRQ